MARVTVRIFGEQEAVALAKRLDKAGDGRLLRHLREAVKDSTDGVPSRLRASALAHLPKRNGLAGEVARSRITITPMAAGDAAVRISAHNKYQIDGMDKGLNVHPLWGDRRHWYPQRVRSGWFSSVVDEQEPITRAAIEEAVATFVV